MKNTNILKQFVQKEEKGARLNRNIPRIIIASIMIALVVFLAYTAVSASKPDAATMDATIQYSLNPELNLVHSFSSAPHQRTQSEVQFTQRYGSPLGTNPELNIAHPYTNLANQRTTAELQFAQRYWTSLAVNPELNLAHRYANIFFQRTQSEKQFAQSYSGDLAVNPEIKNAYGLFRRTQSERQFILRYSVSLAANPELKLAHYYTNNPYHRTQSEMEFTQQYGDIANVPADDNSLVINPELLTARRYMLLQFHK